MGSEHWEAHKIPPHLTEELFPGLTYEEALQDQQALYEVLKIMARNPSAISSSSGRSTGQRSDQASRSWEESYLSENIDVESQLCLDEAMARILQDLEDGIDNVLISEPVQSSTSGNEETATANASSSTTASSSAAGNARESQHDIDPDQMTYEELELLGEAIGSESKGLSEDDISSLPSFKYKSGYFSRNPKAGECAICYSTYKHKQCVTTLPCAHQYHSKCIKRWLRQSKSCPICQAEVHLSS